MKKLLSEKHNSYKRSKRKITKKKHFLNYFDKSKTEIDENVNLKYKYEKNKRKNKNKKEECSIEFSFKDFMIKIFYFILIILIYVKLNNGYKKKIAKRYEYRYQKILENNRTYNESNLLTFEDKLNWLTIHDSTSLKTKCADKVTLHKFSKYILGKDYCNKLLKVYDNAKQINFTELPTTFVLKTNHGSSFNFFVYNKTKMPVKAAQQQMDKWIKIDYGLTGEFYYSFINRKIFAEEYIGSQLKNYKFLCYHGKPKYVYVSIKQGYFKYRNFYDMDWNLLPFKCLSKPHPTYKYEKPKFFELMKKIAAKLSKRFIFVRVDLYELETEVRLGELTFIPMNSEFLCENKEDEITLGKDIIIN